MIHVIKPGIFTTVQDLGRYGFTHLGISPAGAADSVSFRISNLLVGNDMNAPALEMTLMGPTLEFEAPAVIALAGASTSNSIAINQALEVSAGTRIAFGSLIDGARTYLAVRGGIAVPKVMHSCSTLVQGNIGGLHGRALKAGDRIPIGKEMREGCRKLAPAFVERLRPQLDTPLRVTPSLQYDWFEEKEIQRFYQQVFRVRDESDRSGLRLSGEAITSSSRAELLTEGVALGAVQVPPSGQPIILLVDQQTTGGYPKIANVIAADLPRVGQLRPRDQVRFQPVTIEEAIGLLREQECLLAQAFDP